MIASLHPNSGHKLVQLWTSELVPFVMVLVQVSELVPFGKDPELVPFGVGLVRKCN